MVQANTFQHNAFNLVGGPKDACFSSKNLEMFHIRDIMKNRIESLVAVNGARFVTLCRIIGANLDMARKARHLIADAGLKTNYNEDRNDHHCHA